MLFLILGVILVALVFEYINGFHDTANSIATTVSTKVLTPRQAIVWAASFNLIGALWGTAVATTIGKGLVDTQFVTTQTILSALLAAIVWNLLTWWLGLPSSSSHALIGGLCGGTLASAHGQWSVIHWSLINPVTHAAEGLWPKVVLPMFTSPVLGIILGFLIMGLLTLLIHSWRPRLINTVFGKLQIVSAGVMGFSHGTNDAQKTMGIIALILFSATKTNALAQLPSWLQFLYTPEFKVALWVKVTCALTMAAGTAAGGWRIIRTLGHKMVRLQPVHGFAAETTAASIILLASNWGIPVSTTHVISASIMGVGATKRLSAVKWGIVGRMVWAWVLTIPVTAVLAYWVERVLLLLP
ncbi:MAG: inorganic phosphate transporter [Verrucomicrobia bacterium]|nr:MAG: inorganic phosphate transporter [Verrucomicrobiota bacterium]